MRRFLYRVYWKLEALLVPGLASSQYSYFNRLMPLLKNHPVWLDLGCGHQIFAEWMAREQAQAAAAAKRIVGIDLAVPSMRQHPALSGRVMGRLETLPFADQSFDIVTANMVVEHLEHPGIVLREVWRVLKPGGAFVFHTPNRQSPIVFAASLVGEKLKRRIVRFLEGRKEEDIFPTHYRLNEARAIKRIAAEAGFRPVMIDLVSTSAVTVMLGPVVILELLYIRLLRHRKLSSLRTNIVGVLSKPAS
jgi:ubiquinone/menaquinone biosynthesis C-methylase UbiE